MPIRNQSRVRRYADRIRSLIRKKIIRTDQIIKLDHISFVLPPSHRLPEYLEIADQYDRFIPILAQCLGQNSCIIDVGANCGDGLALMYDKNPSARYVTIEPDPLFHSYLKRNIERIKQHDPHARITPFQKMIGKTVLSAGLEGQGGTKTAIVGGGPYNTVTLDALCRDYNISEVDFIKTDVDGYDYDVIASANDIIRKNKPLIFFECWFDTASQRGNYDGCIEALAATGYCDWSVFDNFGHLLVRTGSAEEIRYFFDYVEKNRIPGSCMPLHYIDILAGCQNHHTVISKALTLHDEAAKAAIP